MPKDGQFQDLAIGDRFFFPFQHKQRLGARKPFTKISESQAEEFGTGAIIDVDPHDLVKREKRVNLDEL